MGDCNHEYAMLAGAVPFLEPGVGSQKVECTVCHLFLVMDSQSAAVALAYRHVCEQHPDVYESVVGHPPRPEDVAATVYGLLEGIVPITAVSHDAP